MAAVLATLFGWPAWPGATAPPAGSPRGSPSAPLPVNETSQNRRPSSPTETVTASSHHTTSPSERCTGWAATW